MRHVTCDHCGVSKVAPGLARLDNWSSVRMTVREKHPKHDFMHTTDAAQFELCPDCTTEIVTFLSKTTGAV